MAIIQHDMEFYLDKSTGMVHIVPYGVDYQPTENDTLINGVFSADVRFSVDSRVTARIELHLDQKTAIEACPKFTFIDKNGKEIEDEPDSYLVDKETLRTIFFEGFSVSEEGDNYQYPKKTDEEWRGSLESEFEETLEELKISEKLKKVDK